MEPFTPKCEQEEVQAPQRPGTGLKRIELSKGLTRTNPHYCSGHEILLGG